MAYGKLNSAESYCDAIAGILCFTRTSTMMFIVFAVKAHAEAFLAEFGGERFDPAEQ